LRKALRAAQRRPLSAAKRDRRPWELGDGGTTRAPRRSRGRACSLGKSTHRRTRMMTDLAHLRDSERWIASVRLGGVLFAVVQVALTTGYPHGYERDAWIITALFAAGALIVFALSRRRTVR